MQKPKKDKSKYTNAIIAIVIISYIIFGVSILHSQHEKDKNDTRTALKPQQTIYMRKNDRFPFGGIFEPDEIIRKNDKGGKEHIKFGNDNHVYEYRTAQCLKEYQKLSKKPYITKKQFTQFYKQCKNAETMATLSSQSGHLKRMLNKLAKKVPVVDNQGIEYKVAIKYDELNETNFEGIKFKRKLSPSLYTRNKTYLKDHNLK